MADPIKLKSNKTLAILVCTLISFCLIYSVSAQTTTVNAAASTTQPAVGSSLTVTIAISNVQNLFGIDATLLWNPSVLSLSKVALNIGDSQTNGVLHGTINRDYNNINPGDLYVNETKVSGSYELVAQSFGHNTPSFTGSGTIATLTFNTIGTGSAGLTLATDLADQAVLGQNANNIAHQDTASSVTAVASGSSSTPTSLSTPSSSTTTTPSVPEFPSTITIALSAAIAVVATALIAKKISKRNLSLKTPL
ncbi:MAG: cohesin domain-containing protein [Candidatus Bathyarchaeia archaeon]|jgi:hypothetical protein